VVVTLFPVIPAPRRIACQLIHACGTGIVGGVSRYAFGVTDLPVIRTIWGK
jgi:hypothetical protein